MARAAKVSGQPLSNLQLRFQKTQLGLRFQFGQEI
jgi:hypothetical protein